MAPTPHPLIDLGGFPIYAVMVFIGAVVAILVGLYNVSRYEGTDTVKKYLFLPFMAVSFLAGAATANIGNWFVIPGILQIPVWQRFQEAGYAFYFGIIGFFVFLIIILACMKMNIPAYLNLAVPSVLIFHAIGRIGCSLAGCCYGVKMDINLGLFHLDRFPAREIESLLLFAMFFTVQFGIKRRRMLFYLIAYPIARFFLEFGRGDPRGRMFTDILSPAQEISLIILACVSIYLIVKLAVYLRMRGKGRAKSSSAG